MSPVGAVTALITVGVAATLIVVLHFVEREHGRRGGLLRVDRARGRRPVDVVVTSGAASRLAVHHSGPGDHTRGPWE
jgi:hypothetical protein